MNEVYLKEMVQKALEAEVKKEFDILSKKLLEDLEKRKNQICSGILLDIMKTVDVQSISDRVIFTIREIKQ